MPISNEALDAMVVAGVSAEQIVAAIKADRAKDQPKLAARRERNAERMRRARAQPRTGAHTDAQTRTNEPREQSVGNAATGATSPSGSSTAHAAHTNANSASIKRDTTSSQLEFDEVKKGSGVTRARGGIRLPDDWQPSADDLAFACSIMPAQRVVIEVEKFRDYWHARAGPGAVKRSWPATWRNWCRKAVEGMNGGGNGQHRQTGNGHRGGGFNAFGVTLERAAGSS